MKRKKKYLFCTSQRRKMSEREGRRRGGIANRSFTKSETTKERSFEKMEEREGDEARGERMIKEERIRYWRKGRAYLSLCAVKALKLFWKKERKKKWEEKISIVRMSIQYRKKRGKEGWTYCNSSMFYFFHFISFVSLCTNGCVEMTLSQQAIPPRKKSVKEVGKRIDTEGRGNK